MDIVIVGAGQAGVQVALSLRQSGHAGGIVLIGDEPHPPYQRPPLSKGYLKGEMPVDQLLLRTAASLAEQDIELRTSVHITQIDRVQRLVSGRGHEVKYDNLVLATGTRPRPLPLPGANLSGVLTLRGVEDADRLAATIKAAQDVVIIGGGFIGLEAAATVRLKGKAVTVVEAAPRVMARAVAPAISEWFEAMHRDMGTTILTATGVTAIEGSERAEAVLLANGARLSADLVLVGIGAIPNDHLARDAGLSCPNGIATDPLGRTEDPAIWAVGDCALTHNRYAGGPIRLESVQNAKDQAKSVAAAILGADKPMETVPWFWSDQYAAKLQTTGLPLNPDSHVLRGDPANTGFTIFHIRNGIVIAADSVNSPMEHMAARRLVSAGARIDPGKLADIGIPLNSLLT